MLRPFNVVQISSKNIERFRVYSDTQFIGFTKTSCATQNHIEKEKNPIQSRKHRQQSNFRAKRNMEELLEINFPYNFMLMTLTFKENLVDLDVANTTFTRYIKRVKRYMAKRSPLFQLKYLAVIETQKRGAIHYHVVCNLYGSLVYQDFIAMWQGTISNNPNIKVNGGSVHFKFISEDVDSVKRYLSKYLFTNSTDEMFWGRKSYFTSQNLIKPIRKNHKLDFEKNVNVKKEIENKFIHDIQNKTLAYEDIYYDKYTGKEILYLEYKI